MYWILVVLLAQQLGAGSPAPVAPSASLRGDISVMTDWLPRKEATELRSEVRIEAEATVRSWLRLHADAALDVLAADRDGATADAVGRVNDVWSELRGARGDYRVNMRHGVSRLRSGERYCLGVIFHDAM